MASSVKLCFTPAHTSIRRCLTSLTSLHFSLVDSLLIYAPDIVSWTAWTGRGCSATTNLAWWMHGSWLIQLLRMAALQTKTVAYDNHFTGLGETRLSRYPVCGGLLGWVSAPPQTRFLQCVCILACNFSRYFVFFTAYLVIYLVLPLSSFTRKFSRQSVWMYSIKVLQKANLAPLY